MQISAAERRVQAGFMEVWTPLARAYLGRNGCRTRDAPRRTALARHVRATVRGRRVHLMKRHIGEGIVELAGVKEASSGG